MLTGEMKRVMTAPTSDTFASCDAEGKGRFGRYFGICPGKTDEELIFMLPKAFERSHLENWQTNPVVSINLSEMSTMKTFLFRGKVTDVRTATAEEEKLAKADQAEASPLMETFFGKGAKAGWDAFKSTPSWAVTVQLEAIFDQTPGQTAGFKVF